MGIEIRPAFDAAVMQSELPIRKAAGKTLRLLQSLDLPQLWSYPGPHFEKIHGLIDERRGEQLYSIRLTQSARASVSLRDGPTLVLASLHARHDKAYRRQD
jgi:hypothetical protein